MPEDARDPRHHTRILKARLREMIDHLRSDAEKVDEPRFQALCETSAEVLEGLEKAFGDYERRNEPAWRD